MKRNYRRSAGHQPNHITHEKPRATKLVALFHILSFFVPSAALHRHLVTNSKALILRAKLSNTQILNIHQITPVGEKHSLLNLSGDHSDHQSSLMIYQSGTINFQVLSSSTNHLVLA